MQPCSSSASISTSVTSVAWCARCLCPSFLSCSAFPPSRWPGSLTRPLSLSTLRHSHRLRESYSTMLLSTQPRLISSLHKNSSKRCQALVLTSKSLTILNQLPIMSITKQLTTSSSLARSNPTALALTRSTRLTRQPTISRSTPLSMRPRRCPCPTSTSTCISQFCRTWILRLSSTCRQHHSPSSTCSRVVLPQARPWTSHPLCLLPWL